MFHVAVKIVEVLGTELPIKIFKETIKIEAEGGMTIKVSKIIGSFYFVHSILEH